MTALAGGKSLREREFELLYQECYGTVYGWVRVRMASKEDTEDVVAEAFLHAARAFESFDPSRAKFSTWVTTIARNCMISHFRKQRPSVTLEDVPETTYMVSGGQENREWWEVAINGSKMNWTALRKNKDGSTFTVTFEMNRVL